MKTLYVLHNYRFIFVFWGLNMFQNIPSPSIIYDLKLFLLVKKQSYLDKFFIIEHIEHMTSVTSNVFIKFLSFFFFLILACLV